MHVTICPRGVFASRLSARRSRLPSKYQARFAFSRPSLCMGRRIALFFLTLTALLTPTGRILAQPQTGHGMPQRWEAGKAVSPYQTVNLRTGRVVTTLPVVGWSGRGPSISFSLYHNMTSAQGVLPLEESGGGSSGLLGDANGDGEVDLADVDPFVDIVLSESATSEEVAKADFSGNQQADLDDLDGFTSSLLLSGSPMWTHSYSMRLSLTEQAFPHLYVAHVTRGDGRRDTFTRKTETEAWLAPAGLYETLFADGTGYTLKTKNGWRYHFEPEPPPSIADNKRLAWIADATEAVDAGGLPKNRVTCTYYTSGNGSGKLHKVTDAAGRELVLTYNAQGEIATITDPIGRVWTFLYYDTANPEDPPTAAGDGYFGGLQGPDMDPETPAHPPILWNYTADHEIWWMSDRNGDTYGFAYSEGRVSQVEDPLYLSQ